MTQLRVFLSHSFRDKAFADELARAFREAGVDVWYDEESLGAGHLRRTIMKELTERPVFVVLLSKMALASTWVLDECEWAYDLQRSDPSRIMLPVLVAQLDWADLNAALYLRSLKRVEAGDLRPLPVAEAANQTLRLLGLTPAGQAPIPATPQPLETAEDLVTRGKALVAQKQYTQAIPFFEVATQLSPDSYEAWFDLGHTLNDLKRYEETVTAYERALAIQPDSNAASYNLGKALRSLGRNEEALAAYERNFNANDASDWYNKGNVLRDLKRYEEALVAYDGALALDPNHARAWNNKGTALINLKRYEEALAAFDRASGIEPNALRWNNKARVLRALGREAEAQEAEYRARELGG